MIRGIGIDSVDIVRFSSWNTFSYTQLLRIFSAQEIDYCLAVPTKSAERFAARFAAREAFFKAFSVMVPGHQIPFLTVCRHIAITKDERGKPELQVNWEKLGFFDVQQVKTHLSLTHTNSVATGVIILEGAS